ncbi:Abl interactor 1-like protein [Dinothrombium tinctorium]|uniref:Abl interactor 1-like protein n=1 Tax=Dinothrombium tinctorium TaxID=1965070 RepID=A0A443RRM1_9ACAR|nr:Abl interactor 1-like protein [Dinothrombium tinctorium]
MTVHSNKMPSAMNDLLSLIENEIPDGRQNLQESHSNLEKVADYCESNYFQADNKRQALEETKNYCTQSLASVAYQINTLAYNLLHLLDLQVMQMDEMESQINHISQTVAIHKEKVARREIGILTTNKAVTRQHKILVPANPERPVKYIRKPIDYSILDDIGHGVKITTNTPRSKRISGQSQMNGSNTYMANSAPAPTTKPPTPPQSVRGVGSLSRGSKEYRTPAPPIAPPQVPSNYAPNYPLGHPRAHDSARRGSGYSTLPVSMAHQGGHISAAMQQMSRRQEHYQQTLHQQQQQQQQSQPQVGMVHPLTHTTTRNMASNNFVVPPSPTPPPPPPPPVQNDIPSSPVSDSLPEPPMHLQHSMGDQIDKPGNGAYRLIQKAFLFNNSLTASPPLPPPPPIEEQMYNNDHQSQDNDWIPKSYIEKVVAIYDYTASRDDELSFSENSVIYVIKKNDDGWYEGVLDGITGLFPGNYVEPCL